MSPKVLDQVLSGIPRMANENVLVGFDTSDDAGVYRIGPECALVQTVDFFTPIVDDPETFGAIAAANSLSDVYAMGGVPITSLSILAYPVKGDLDVLRAILKGGAEKMKEAECALLGGHSVNDDEIKFGYSVTGTVHPKRVWTNAGAKPGDVLVFTKRIGTGVIATAQKRGIASAEHTQDAERSMLQLNRVACGLLQQGIVHGCTDVSGFGLLGHAREMAIASGVTLRLNLSALRFLPGAEEYARAGAVPGGLNNNREFVEGAVGGVMPDPVTGALLYDPQTSGGLLVSLPATDADRFLALYPDAYALGIVSPFETKPILLT